jgi:glycosyltransferase involved in cell wall biosynthesis
VSATVSVVLPVRDGGDLLRDALDSIAAQTHPVLEVLVVDSHSTDDSAAVAAAAGCRVLSQEGPGLADAYNTGVLAARGSHLAFLAHDDIWMPDKLERQLALLADGGDAAIGMTRFELADGVTAPPGFRSELLHGVHRTPVPEALLVERATFDRVGTFRREVATAFDVDWFARFSDLGLSLVTVDAVVLVKRITVTSTSHVAPGAEAGLLRALRESVRRKQAGA